MICWFCGKDYWDNYSRGRHNITHMERCQAEAIERQTVAMREAPSVTVTLDWNEEWSEKYGKGVKSRQKHRERFMKEVGKFNDESG